MWNHQGLHHFCTKMASHRVHIRQKPSLPGEKPEQAKVCKASGTKSRRKEVDKGAAQLANYIFGRCAMCNVFQIIQCPQIKWKGKIKQSASQEDKMCRLIQLKCNVLNTLTSESVLKMSGWKPKIDKRSLSHIDCFTSGKKLRHKALVSLKYLPLSENLHFCLAMNKHWTWC